MKASENCYKLIKESEGLKRVSYKCPAGVWTIGYGHTRDVRPDLYISVAQAESLLKQDVAIAEDVINKEKFELTQGQFDALVSFVFNVKLEDYKKSTLRKYVKEKKYEAAAGEFHKWIYSGGVILNGLITRRAEEVKLWNS